jgi:diacylglycerol kinase
VHVLREHRLMCLREFKGNNREVTLESFFYSLAAIRTHEDNRPNLGKEVMLAVDALTVYLTIKMEMLNHTFIKSSCDFEKI